MHPHLRVSGEADASTHTHPPPPPTSNWIIWSGQMLRFASANPRENLQKHIVSFAAFYSLASL